MRHAIFDNMAHHQSRMTVNKSRGISKSPCLFSEAGINPDKGWHVDGETNDMQAFADRRIQSRQGYFITNAFHLKYVSQHVCNLYSIIT